MNNLEQGNIRETSIYPIAFHTPDANPAWSSRAQRPQDLAKRHPSKARMYWAQCQKCWEETTWIRHWVSLYLSFQYDLELQGRGIISCKTQPENAMAFVLKPHDAKSCGWQWIYQQGKPSVFTCHATLKGENASSDALATATIGSSSPMGPACLHCQHAGHGWREGCLGHGEVTVIRNRSRWFVKRSYFICIYDAYNHINTYAISRWTTCWSSMVSDTVDLVEVW